MTKTNLLTIFVKAPRYGKVKTRLGEKTGYEQARRIHMGMTEDLLANFKQRTRFELRICFWPPDAREEMEKWLGTGYRMVAQTGKNLGEKMDHAFQQGFEEGYRKIVIIGSDLPEISGDDIHKVLNSLDTHDLVIGPARDGGYYLIGLKAIHPKLFRDITWSTGEVFRLTIRKARELGLSVDTLDEREDIDDEESLFRFWNKYKTKTLFPRTIYAIQTCIIQDKNHAG